MNRPIEQVLSTLLPTHADELPPELVRLAQSLVAQSRSYSTTLKPEEEIARPYACAEIACKRLARALKLPPLLGHPPCPPRVYTKLYAFLDRSLANSTVPTRKSATGSAPGTPTRPSSAATTPTKKGSGAPTRTPSKTSTTTPGRLQNNTPSRPTPLNQSIVNGSDTPSKQQSVKRARFHGVSDMRDIKDAPVWVMPSIRTVCKTLSTPAPRMSLWSRPPISRTLPPHIFAGVSSILHFVSSLSERALDEEAAEFIEPLRTAGAADTEDYKELVMSLIVGVYFLVLARQRTPRTTTTAAAATTTTTTGSPRTMDPPKMDKKTFTEMRQTALSSLGLLPTEKRHGEDVDAWIALIMNHQWAKGQEWFENIPLAGEGDDDGDADGGDLYDGDDDYDDDRAMQQKRRKTELLLREAGDTDKEGLLLPGLGTMMQARVDYLSEDRREDFREWKMDILARIKQIERPGKTKGKKVIAAAA